MVCIFKSTFFQYISGHQVQNPFHPAVTLQNIYPKERVIQSRRDLCLRILITGLFFFFFFFFFFQGRTQGIRKFPGQGVKSELQLLAYATATAMQDPSHVCDLHHRSWQHQISIPWSKARDGTHIVMDTSWVRFCCVTMRTLDYWLVQLGIKGWHSPGDH